MTDKELVATVIQHYRNVNHAFLVAEQARENAGTGTVTRATFNYLKEWTLRLRFALAILQGEPLSLFKEEDLDQLM